jgi:SAM-dependent methyltransferase
LGFVPAVEWAIFGKSASAGTRGSPVLAPQRQNRDFNTASPPIEVEWQCNPTDVQRLFERVATTWEQLGNTRPHWSVLTFDEYLPSSIAAHEEEFFASGQPDVHRLMATIRRVGRVPADVKIVHEFGCGIGRVTNHLAEEFDHVIACDVSRPHLDLARAHTQRLKRNNVDYRLAQLPDFGMTEPFDLWFTMIALQHNPPPIMVMVLKRALHCLRAGGLAVFQLPTYAASYVFKADDYLASPPSPTGIEMHVLPQGVLFELVRDAGCVLLEITHNGLVGGDNWLSNFVVVEKPLA